MIRGKQSIGAVRRGFTLLEMVVALSIFSVIGFTLMSAVRMAHQSHLAVVAATVENIDRREASARLIEELASANSATIEVVSLAGVNDSVSFELPITVAGDSTWGVREESLSQVPAEQSVAGWRVRYAVVAIPVNGVAQNSLVRQVLDELDVVRMQEQVVDGVRGGALNPKGFGVVVAGEMWELTLTTEGNAEGSEGRSTVFHVKTRN